MQKDLEKIILKITRQKFTSQLEFDKVLRKIAGQFNVAPPAKRQILAGYKKLVRTKKVKPNLNLEKILVKSQVRSSSGVSVITVLTKPYNCPGTCAYCPHEPKMPVSYLSNEPAAQRAVRLKFEPIKMVQKRIEALEINGHAVDKIELLILGGSFTAYNKKYQEEFVTKCFWAANNFGKQKRKIKSLENEQKINEKAKYKIIGLTIETRPDEINEKIVQELRQLGCTRVQIGVQHTDDKILKIIKRGHNLQDSIQATKLLKENGFKVDHHYMPDLPGSTPAKDLKMMEKAFNDESLKPDQIKIYPCVVSQFALIAKWLKQKKYKPYSTKQLEDLLFKIKKITPSWVRINRLIRDIPEESILAGNKITNLRQVLQERLKKEGNRCNCIRCREVGHQNSIKNEKPKLFIKKYKASLGTEYFISFENSKQTVLFGFVRLRLNSKQNKPVFDVLKEAAIVRELHVYGQLVPVGDKFKTAVQHTGLGKKLMEQAEKITAKHGIKKLAVIAGVGVRDYYKKLGFKLQETYMVKKIK